MMDLKSRNGFDSLTQFLLPAALIIGLVLLLGLDTGSVAGNAEVHSPIENWLRPMVAYLASGAEIAAATVIGVGVVVAIVQYVGELFVRRPDNQHAADPIRVRLGRTLVLGLEFTLASDILRTAVAPTRHDIINLGAIIMLRTLLNFFLEREIQQWERIREKPAAP